MKSFVQTCLLLTLSYATLSGQVVINEIIPPNTVELKNLGGGTVNIGPYTLCRFPNYNQLSTITLVCGGDLMIEAGALVAVNLTYNLGADDDELALYFTNGNFTDPGNIADYVEWGSHGHTRSSVAEAAGIWTDGDFVPSFTGCASIEYDGSGNASTDWVSQDVATSPCIANTLDGCGGANCDIAGAGLTNINCNNNGTPSNPNDDFITFNLNPTGVDLATTYSVSVDMGTISPMSAAYGAPTAFQLQNGSAGDGDVVVTITDDDDPSCTFMVTVNDPGSCSDQCDLTSAGLSGVFCNDAGTPSDGTDDFIMFNLSPSGLNLGSSYSVSVSSGSVMPASADYGVLTTFELNTGSAGNGNVTVTITDDDDGTCTIMALIVDPGTCSDDCDLTDAGLDDVSCDDNGTTTDADDFITFTLNPAGTNLGVGYSVSVSSGTINPTSGDYGATQFFSLNIGSAGSGNVTVTITDEDDLACDIDVVIVDPGSCSEACNLSGAGLTGTSCNDNGTPSDPSDDFIIFNLNPTGVNLGSTYNVSVSIGTINPMSGPYGVPTGFNLNMGSAGDGDVTVTITDASDPSCTIEVIVTDPGTCSTTCDLTGTGLGAISCNDNGTSTDPSDDLISFSLNPTGFNLGATYTVSVSTGTVNPVSGAYGAVTAFNMNTGSAGNGDVTVTVTDDNDPLCTISVVVTDPGTCSNGCDLTDAGLSSVVCNSNGTMDDSDDFISFMLNPTGTGLFSSYVVFVSSGTVTPDTVAYGAATSFVLNAGSAGNGDVTVTVTDLGDPTCSISVVVTDPGTCSESCNLTSSGLSNVTCNDNSTPDNADDFIVFTLDPVGTLLGTDYQVSVSNGTVDPTSGTYGMMSSFSLNNGSAGSGEVTITITDATDPSCSINAVITDPGACSEAPCEVAACDISTDSETMICVDEGGDPDSVVVICHPGTQGMNSSWVVTDTNGIIQSIIAFSDTVAFTFEGQGSGVCLIWLVAWDGTLSGLTPGEEIDTLSGCFDLSNPITVTKLTGTECESSTYNPALSDLIYLYPMPVSGVLRIDAPDVTIHHVRVMDIIGRTMFQLDQLDPTEIDMGDLDMGLYYLMFETNRGWNLQRVLVGK